MMNTIKVDLTEMAKLGQELVLRGADFLARPIFGGMQIVVYEDDERVWDAICHEGSYGHENGLLEIMGTICDDDDVIGYLTADDVIARL